MNQNKTVQITLAGMFLALALVLPFVTGQIPSIGSMLCPMHIPVLLCGFFCGPLYGAIVGFIAPLLRYALFGMPPIMPTGISMAFELCTYGLVSGLLYKKFAKTNVNVYITLLVSMLCGRIVWGIVRVVLMGLTHSEFSWAAFLSGAFTTAIPGIFLQIILIPILVIVFKKYSQNK